MNDWKTTASGTVLGACMLVGHFIPFLLPFCAPIGALAAVALGYFAADKS